MKIIKAMDCETTELDIAIKAIGICDALISHKITITTAEQLLFKPAYYLYYEKQGIDLILINFLIDGSELEDVESLFPDKLEMTIHKLYTNLINYLETLEIRNFATHQGKDSKYRC